MTYAERVELYRQIEEERGRPLITYVTSSRPNAEGVIASDVIPEFCRQILEIPEDERKIDLLIVSRGGDPIVSWRIISLLRERFDEVGVLIPYEAYSAATLLALGANEIVMHPFSNLGPVDPQLQIVKNIEGKQEKLDFAAEDLAHFLDFVRYRCRHLGSGAERARFRTGRKRSWGNPHRSRQAKLESRSLARCETARSPYG